MKDPKKNKAYPKLKQKRLNHNNIISFLSEFCNNDLNSEKIWVYGNITPNGLIKILKRSNSIQSIYNRYKKIINSSKISENSESSVQSFSLTNNFIRDNLEKLDINKLTKNKSITWTPSLIDICINKLDFKILARHGNITKESIIKYDKKWDKIAYGTVNGRRNSDGPYSYGVKYRLWRNLCLNENICWDDELLTKYINKIPISYLNGDRVEISIKFINQNWNYYKHELSYYENYDGNKRIHKHKILLREQIKNCKIKDLTLKKFIQHEIKWFGTLCSENFLNQSISNLILSKYNSENNV